jgi:hypothetical protein
MNPERRSMIHPIRRENIDRVTRRQMFGKAASGVGCAALASLLQRDATGAESTQATWPGLPDLPHFAAKAKRVVMFWQGGGRPRQSCSFRVNCAGLDWLDLFHCFQSKSDPAVNHGGCHGSSARSGLENGEQRTEISKS